MRLLLDEMYSPALAAALREAGHDAAHIRDLGMAGAPDAEVLATATVQRRAVLTENIADFARIAADEAAAGRHHGGILMALSARFSRRRSGIPALVAAIDHLGDAPTADRVIYLNRADPPDA